MLRAIGQRYTGSRRAIVEALHEAGRPMMLPDLLAQRPDLAQSSAYRNLSELEAAGVVRRIVTTEEHSRFELAEGLTGHHHHHLICTTCGSVEDFVVPPSLEREIERAMLAVNRKHGFATAGHQLDLHGACERCR